MKFLILVSCLAVAAVAEPGLLASPYAAHPLAYHASAAVVAPAAITSQYHAQDELGQYSYGYQGDTSAKQEVRTFDGVTRGGYSYLDANGLVQSASYVSDPVHGFRVAATNLPVGPAAPAAPLAAVAAPVAVAAAPAVVANSVPLETPEVAAARAAHYQAHAIAKANLLGRKKRGVVGAYAAPAVVAHHAAYAAPAAVVAAPARSFAYSSVSAHPATIVGAAAPAVVAHHAAYAAPAVVAHHAAYAAPAVVAHHGAYAAPIAAHAVVANSVPLDTPEVAHAKAAHFQAHALAKANLLGRKKRGVVGAYAAPAVVAHHTAYATPVVAAHHVAAAPIVAAAPAVVAHHGLAHAYLG